jgi:hypothetical protein
MPLRSIANSTVYNICLALTCAMLCRYTLTSMVATDGLHAAFIPSGIGSCTQINLIPAIPLSRTPAEDSCLSIPNYCCTLDYPVPTFCAHNCTFPVDTNKRHYEIVMNACRSCLSCSLRACLAKYHNSHSRRQVWGRRGRVAAPGGWVHPSLGSSPHKCGERVRANFRQT